MLIGYQKITTWQKAHQLAMAVYTTTKKFPKEELFGLTSQMRRAVLSIPTNIAEGYARQNNKVFRTFLDIAYGSLVETEYLLTFAHESGLLDYRDYQKLLLISCSSFFVQFPS